MTVTAKTTKVQYTGTGLVSTFAFDWKILEDEDLVVVSTDADDLDTVLVLDTDYTVSGAGGESGSVTLADPLGSGLRLTIYPGMDIEQPTDLTNQQSPFLERIEAALDRQALISQQLKVQLDQCVQLPASSTEDPTEYIAVAQAAVADAEAAQAAAATSASSASTSAAQASTSAAQASNSAQAAATSVAVKPPVKVATTANITLSGEQTIDGVACVAGDRVLVWAQSTVSQNGIYTVAAGAWSRPEDADGAGDLALGTQVTVQQGSTYAGLTFQLTAPAGTITPGTSAITWACTVKVVMASGSVSSPAWAFLSDLTTGFYRYLANQWGFAVAGVHRILFNAYGIMVQTTDSSPTVTDSVGVAIRTTGQVMMNADGAAACHVARKTSDGGMIGLWRAGVSVATVSVASGVVTWGTFCGAHWSRFKEDPGDVWPGTVLDSIGEPVVWEDDPGYAYLPMCKISDKEGSKNVLGVFFSRDVDSPEYGDIHVASLGAYYIRMQPGQTPENGDYLESAGDGTARVQADDLLRASTIAKVTVPGPLHTYPDGSFLVGCTLHCG